MTITKQWVMTPKIQVPEKFQTAIGGHPMVAETLYRRGFQAVEAAQAFLNPDLYTPSPPEELPDMMTAVELLVGAIRDGKHILVWGDFDVDGQTATTTLVEGLQACGARVSYHIPIREKESHGIKKAFLSDYISRGFDLLLTCDTGITEHDNIQTVRNLNIPVIVTDHHTLGETLPNANAVVNPLRLPADHALRTLPGVGVTYKLIEALYAALSQPFDADHYTELAALGIVSDVAEQVADTRYLLQKGLLSLRKTKRVGLQTLYQNAGLNPQNLNESHIGFQIGPRLNAIGRLGDANPMVEFLTTQDQGRARVLASQIEAMNAKRRFDTRQVTKAAEAMLQNISEDRHAPAIILHHPDWPGGVVGIVASRLVDDYQKPAILLTGQDPIHGSARSVEGVNITEVIATQADRLLSFGGHPMAAGLALPAEALSSVKFGIQAEVKARVREVEQVPQLEIDQIITLDEITFDFIDEIRRLAPFGAGNLPLHYLIRNLNLVSDTTVGQQGEHRQIIVVDEDGNTQKIIWWNGGEEPLPEAQFDLVCTLSKSDYRGEPQITVEWIDAHLSEQGQKQIASRKFAIIDRRGSKQPQGELDQVLQEHPHAAIWFEGEPQEGIAGLSRTDLGTAPTLVIWTAPPSQNVLQNVLRKVKPETVIVFGQMPQPSSVKALLARLAGLAKYAAQFKSGNTTLTDLAAACAVDTEVTRVGLLYWGAAGKLCVDFEGEAVTIKLEGSAPDQAALEIYQKILGSLFEENRLYREYFRSGNLQNFLSTTSQ